MYRLLYVGDCVNGSRCCNGVLSTGALMSSPSHSAPVVAPLLLPWR